MVFPLLMLPSVITAVACVLYASRARSRWSTALAIGAVGVPAAGIAWYAFELFVLPRLLMPSGGLIAATVSAYEGVGPVLGSLFELVFSISLLFVLGMRPRREAAAGPSDDRSASDPG